MGVSAEAAGGPIAEPPVRPTARASMLQLVALPALPESPRWCVAHGRPTDAEASLEALRPAGALPPARAFHSADAIGGSRMIVFGGTSMPAPEAEYQFRNDVWLLKCGPAEPTWEECNITGTPPAPRYGHTALLAGSRIIIFGGKGGKSLAFKDLHALDPVTMTWYQGPGGAGDAIVTIEVKPHPFFTRDGDNVLLDLPITLNEAVAGGKVKVPTVDGPVMLGVPAGTTSGKTLRLRGKGFTGKDGTRGDQLVTLMVDVPADDPAIQALVEKWQDRRAVRAHLGV